jgi:protein regulator of cytokinesis 1
MVGTASLASLRASNTCNSLLKELQQIWTEIGESEQEKDRLLMEIERECLEVYKRKVDEAANSKARLHQLVAAREAELATLMAALGEHNIHSPKQSEKKGLSLKNQLMLVTPLVGDLKSKKAERLRQFADINNQIDKISSEISGYSHIVNDMGSLNLDEDDLSLRKLTQYQSHLQNLQKEKSDRLHKVLEYVNEVHYLCGVLGSDFSKTVSDVHPSLQGLSIEQSTNISDTTLDGLEQAIHKLKSERKLRFHKIKEIATTLFDLWNLMDSTNEDKLRFSKITSVLGSSEAETEKQGALTLEIIQQASSEVERLTSLKASRMKELVIKRRVELEDICRKIHVEPDPSTVAEKSNAMIDSGLVDPCELLANIELEINKAKEEALSRKDIMDRIQRWLSACDEEKWLEEYNQDDTRYSAGRGAHVNLKRAERARITVNKIPAIVDNLIHKTLAWENEKNKMFLYDGVRLVAILEDYKVARQQKEEEKKRYKEQKKLQDMLLAEKASIYGSKPSPRRSSSFRKAPATPNGYRSNGIGSPAMTPRRYSAGSPAPSEIMTPRSYSGRQNGNHHFKEMRRLSTAPLNFVSIPKEDTISFSSICGSDISSPP